jgi:hypothetical protein
MSFRFVWFRFDRIRFVSFDFVSFGFVSFRFYFVSHFTGKVHPQCSILKTVCLVSHIFSLQTVTTFEPIIWSHWNSNLICILWYQTTVQNLKYVLKLYLETVIRAYIDFLISTFLGNSHSKFPTIWTIYFNSQLHLTIPFCLFNSIILQYLPHVTHFPKSLPLSHFPQTVPTLSDSWTPFSRISPILRKITYFLFWKLRRILGNIIFQTLHKIHIDSVVFCIK